MADCPPGASTMTCTRAQASPAVPSGWRTAAAPHRQSLVRNAPGGRAGRRLHGPYTAG
jgi:hypothetical protein